MTQRTSSLSVVPVGTSVASASATAGAAAPALSSKSKWMARLVLTSSVKILIAPLANLDIAGWLVPPCGRVRAMDEVSAAVFGIDVLSSRTIDYTQRHATQEPPRPLTTSPAPYSTQLNSTQLNSTHQHHVRRVTNFDVIESYRAAVVHETVKALLHAAAVAVSLRVCGFLH